MAVGTSTTNSLYQLFGGFLYFPFVSTPSVSATAGTQQVALAWTSADASTGWAVGGYTVGQSTASGGSYSYTSVGNVLASTRTNLTAGTTYYFVILVEDALGNYIATSTEVSAVPTAPSSGGGDEDDGGSSGGGGGGGGRSSGTTGTGSVTFSGMAYPGSAVTLLKDAQIAVTSVAGGDSRFQMGVGNLSGGSYIFSVHSEDSMGRRSYSSIFPITLTDGGSASITGIFLAPTIAIDKSQVKKGDNIAIFGQTAPESEVIIQVNSDEPHFVKTPTDADGIYLYNFDTAPLEYGGHSTKSKGAKDGEISPYSPSIVFAVGNANILAENERVMLKGDLNNDGRVNLVDFSIVAYWYKKSAPPARVDINNDGKVDLIDFSIMAYYWTG